MSEPEYCYPLSAIEKRIAEFEALKSKLAVAVKALTTLKQYCVDGEPCSGSCDVYEHKIARKALAEIRKA